MDHFHGILKHHDFHITVQGKEAISLRPDIGHRSRLSLHTDVGLYDKGAYPNRQPGTHRLLSKEEVNDGVNPKCPMKPTSIAKGLAESVDTDIDRQYGLNLWI